MHCHREGKLHQWEPKGVALNEEFLDRDGVKELLQVPQERKRVLLLEAGNLSCKGSVLRGENRRGTGRLADKAEALVRLASQQVAD